MTITIGTLLMSSVTALAMAPNACQNGTNKDAYAKGYESGQQFVGSLAESADREGQYLKKIEATLPDIVDNQGGGKFNDIAYCTTVGYVDAIVKESKTATQWKKGAAERVIGYFSGEAKSRLCAVLTGQYYAEACQATAAKSVEGMQQFSGVQDVNVELVGGSANVRYVDGIDSVQLKILSKASGAHVTASKEGGNLKIVEAIEGRTGSGSPTQLEILLPKNSHLAIKSVSGDLKFVGTPSYLEADTVSGNINMQFIAVDFSGTTKLKSVSGDIYMDIPSNFRYSGKVKSTKGSVDGPVNIVNGAPYELRIGAVGGNIHIGS